MRSLLPLVISLFTAVTPTPAPRAGTPPGARATARRAGLSPTRVRSSLERRPFRLSATALNDLLTREAGYIDNCSFTECARNHQAVRWAADAYGAINVNRIADRGPDWVRPGEAAMGAIGLMAAARQLHTAGLPIRRHDRVLSRFFRVWLLARRQPLEERRGDADRGGIFERVYYDSGGKEQRHDAANAGATGQVIAAMWKYYEYHLAVGQRERGWEWLRQAWPVAREGGDLLRRCYDPEYQMVRSHAGSADLWLPDSVYAAMALRCLERWGRALHRETGARDGALARQITEGIERMRDNKTPGSFFRYREARRAYRPTYGDRIDQLCFLPYEADVLDPGSAPARKVSDEWTRGAHGVRMTCQGRGPDDWRRYGTHWWYLFPGARERETNRYLYPGPGLELAKVEWKRARWTGDRVALARARQRFDWAYNPAYSDLWLGAGAKQEANVPDGLLDWRDAADYRHKAADWARFVDSSAYFIEVALMVGKGVDTRYVPYQARRRGDHGRAARGAPLEEGTIHAQDHRRRDRVFRRQRLCHLPQRAARGRTGEFSRRVGAADR